MLKDFGQFIRRGNIMDLAVGVVLGVAFGAIIQSFVKDILMPPIGLLLGKVDFSGLFWNMSGTDYATLAEAQKAGAATMNYGLFVNTVINFVIIAFAVFMVLKVLNRGRAPETTACPYCTSTVSVAATRCPYCTSELEAAKAE